MTTKNAARPSRFERLEAELNKGKFTRQEDTRQWRPSQDKSGNGYAIVRLLPELDTDTNPGYVKVFRHAFEGPGGWYIENCLTTIGQEDPVHNHVQPFWKSGLESDKVLATKRGRKATYYTNVLVVEDPENPENVGKVFIWSFGQKIFDMLKALFSPDSKYDEKRDPWDITGEQGGGNFRIKIKKNAAGFNDYGMSAFDSATPISLRGKKLSEKEIEDILAQRHSLDALIAPGNFKSYEELEKLLNRALGGGGRPRRVEEAEAVADDTPPWEKKAVEQPAARPKPAPRPKAPAADEDDDAVIARLLADDE